VCTPTDLLRIEAKSSIGASPRVTLAPGFFAGRRGPRVIEMMSVLAARACPSNTRSVHEEVAGINELKNEHLSRINRGIVAYVQLQKLIKGDNSKETRELFEKTKADLGFGLLLKSTRPTWSFRLGALPHPQGAQHRTT